MGCRADGGGTLPTDRAEQGAQAGGQSRSEFLGGLGFLVLREEVDPGIFVARRQRLTQEVARFFAEENTEGVGTPTEFPELLLS